MLKLVSIQSARSLCVYLDNFSQSVFIPIQFLEDNCSPSGVTTDLTLLLPFVFEL